MTSKQSIAEIEALGKLLKEADGDLLRRSVERLYTIFMDLEIEQKIGASRYERSENRVTCRNGSRSRTLDTSVGRLNLNIPKLRQGSYMPSFIEPRRMTDKALVNIIQEAYINGVSTRKVDNLVESIGLDIDKSKVSRICKEIGDTVEAFKSRRIDGTEYPYVYLDATFPKVRENGQVHSMALLVAIGVNRDGNREVLGFEVSISESGASWSAFLNSLISRGLGGVKMVISDAHTGLREAINSVFTGASWQRCRVHFMRNILAEVPKKQKGMVSTMVRTIFSAENKNDAKAQVSAVLNQLSGRFPRAMSVLEQGEEDVLAYMDFPQKHWQQIYSSNVLERLNKEIRRRINVVQVFPDRNSVIRLAGAVLMEQHDEWIAAEKRYLSLDSMNELYLHALTTDKVLSLPQPC